LGRPRFCTQRTGVLHHWPDTSAATAAVAEPVSSTHHNILSIVEQFCSCCLNEGAVALLNLTLSHLGAIEARSQIFTCIESEPGCGRLQQKLTVVATVGSIRSCAPGSRGGSLGSWRPQWPSAVSGPIKMPVESRSVTDRATPRDDLIWALIWFANSA